MKTIFGRGKGSMLVFQFAVIIGVFALGWYSGKRTVTGGNLPGENTAKNTAKGHSRPVIIGEAEAKATLAQMIKAAKGKNDNEKIINYLESLSADTIKALLEDSDTNAKTVRDYVHIGNLISRWAELDPNSALTWTLSHDLARKDNLIRDIYLKWPMNDPSAFASLTQLKGSLHDEIFKYLIENYASLDPAAAFAVLSKEPLSQVYTNYPIVFANWAKNDPTAAAAAALNLPPGEMRMRTVENVADAWANTDPTAAMAWVNTLPSGSAKDNALARVVVAMSSENASVIANSLSNYNIAPGAARDNLLTGIASNFAAQDPTGALAWADGNLTGKDFETVSVAALRQINNTDPAAAAAYLAKIPDVGVINQALPAILTNWGSQDPEAALAWAQSLPADNVSMRNSAITSVFSTWTTSDPATAGNYILQNLATDPSFNTLATQVINSWDSFDPQSAFNWALSLPTNGGTRINSVTAALGALANVDPQTAMQDAQELSGNNGYRAEASVISGWANQQPDQAAAALQNLPAGNNLDTATANVAKSWLSQDPNAATQWINTLSAGTARDAAVNQIVSSVGNSDPASAFNWAITISDETDRNNQVVKLATKWSSQNPAAAATAAQNALDSLTGLTSAQQTSLQKIVRKAAGP